ncbi:MAG: MlaD family protein [Treponema sp.]|nr:MlaD family protein [Treponema sp.]
MKFSIRFADQIVGVLVIFALAFLIFVFFMLGTTQRWFKRDLQYRTYFNSAQGLSVNMAVKFKGFTIGNVKTITLKDDRVEVFFSIHEEYTNRVKEGSLVEVQVSPIGLGNNFIFHPGSGFEILEEGAEIFEASSERGREILKRGLNSRTETSDSIAAMMTQAQVLLESLNVALFGFDGYDKLMLGQIVSEIKDAISNVSDVTRTLSNHFEPIMQDVVTLTGQIASPSGTVMAALDSERDFYKAIERSIMSISGIIDSLDKTIAAVPDQMPQVEILVKQLNVTLNSINDVLVAIANNPLLKGGIPEKRESGPGGASSRNIEF